MPYTPDGPCRTYTVGVYRVTRDDLKNSNKTCVLYFVILNFLYILRYDKNVLEDLFSFSDPEFENFKLYYTGYR